MTAAQKSLYKEQGGPLETVSQLRWVRAKQGWIFGVCQGLSRTLGVDPTLVRALAALSVCLFGSGILFYLVAAITFPLEGDTHGTDKKFPGVCHRIAKLTGLEIGLVRFLTVILALPSLGTSALVYVVLHFALKDSPTPQPQKHQDRSL